VNDDDFSELILRASAYLDGELDADERERAESDPAVMAEVEALRALQAEVRDVEPPGADAREAAIAAALAEFDALQPAPAAASGMAAQGGADRVVPFRPRPSYARWLTAAAAVVGVGLVGVVIAQGTRGGDDDSVAIEADSADALNAERAETAAADTELQSAVADAGTLAASDAAELAAPEAMTATAEEEEEEGPSEAPNAGGDELPSTEITIPSTLAPFDVPATTAPRTVDEPVTEDTLYAFGRELLAQYQAGTLDAIPETACEFGSYVVLARVGFIVGTEEREAIIAADPEFPEVGAFDAATCLDFAIVTGE
jgi:hypothetical protein